MFEDKSEDTSYLQKVGAYNKRGQIKKVFIF